MKKAVLFIHGFSAYPEDNMDFENYMRKKRKIDFYTFFLPGHGDEKIKKATRKEWVEEAEKNLKMILEKYDKVTLIGHSMGGLIASFLATQYSQVEKCVLIAPAFKIINIKQIIEDAKNVLKKNIDINLGTGFEKTNKLRKTPLSNMIELANIIHENKDCAKDITCPVLILHGDKDNVVPLSSSIQLMKQLKSEKCLTIIQNVRHQVFISYKKNIVFKYIYRYIMDSKIIRFKEKNVI